ncbi:hypothetical protein AB3R30_16350 [Leptolyngbyaceae cyanobacterium UHCC 1019]
MGINFRKTNSGDEDIPTQAQVFQCFTLCCWLTRLYTPIQLVRLDQRNATVYILAGEDLEFEIQPDGRWMEG